MTATAGTTGRAPPPAATSDKTTSTRKDRDSCRRVLPHHRYHSIRRAASRQSGPVYNPALNHPGYIFGSGSDTRVFLGALSELILTRGWER
jgi:hypothetical protein